MAEDVRTVLRRETGLLVERLRPWEEPRYQGRAPAWGGGAEPGTRREVAQHLADVLAAPVLARAGLALTVPRLPYAVALPDQLAVLAADLLEVEDDPGVLRAVLAEVLLHRADLDGSGPGALATAAAGDPGPPGEAVRRWRAACALSPQGAATP